MRITAKLALILGVTAAVACTEPAPPPIQIEAPPPPAVKVFTAAPTEVVSGGATTLTWEVENAKSVSIELLGIGPVPGVSSTQLKGQIEVTIERDSLFLLTAHGEGGIDQQSAGVFTVGTSRSVLLTAIPSSIVAGERASLVWSAAGASSVSLADESGNAVDIGSPAPASGVVDVQPGRTTRYVLTADNRSVSTEVRVGAIIHDFRASEGPYLPGQQVTLHWRTGAATALTITADGRGEIYAPTAQGEVTEGSYTDTLPGNLPLNSRVDYTLVLEQGSRKIERQLRLNIGVNPQIEPLDLPAYAAKSGALIDIGWTVNGADAIDVYTNGAHAFRTTDPDQVRVGTLEDYAPPAGLEEVQVRVVATNAMGGHSEMTGSVDLVGAPSIDPTTGFTASPANGTGGDPVTLTWNVTDARNAVITNSSGKVVATATGLDAQSGSTQVYPNADEVYTLTVDNTLGDSDEASVSVSITTIGLNTRGDNGVFVQGASADLYLDALPTETNLYKLAEDFVRVGGSQFQDISATGTPVTLLPDSSSFSELDEGTAVIYPDFTLDFLGTTVSGAAGITFSSNGWLAFGNYSGASDGYGTFPSAANNPFTIAPFWEDLEFEPTGGIHYQLTGTGPDRTLVVQWSNTGDWLNRSSLITFQARIKQSGDVAFTYKLLTGNGSSFSGNIGIQGVDSTRFAKASMTFGAAGIANDMTYFLGLLEYTLPVTVTLQSAGPYDFMVKRGDEFMPISFTVPTLVKVNDVSIAEIMYSPLSPYEATGEWIELRNRSGQDIDLDGFELSVSATDVITLASNTPGDTVIPAGGVYVLAQSAVDTENGGVVPHYVYGASYGMADTSGALSLAKGGIQVSSFSFNNAFGGQGGPGIAVMNDYAPYLTALGASVSARVCEPAATTVYGASVGTGVTQQGSPGEVKSCSPYVIQPIQSAFTDITEAPYSAAALFPASFPDNAVATFDLGLPYPYFGVTPATNSSVKIGSNGYITFDMVKTISSTYQPTLYPSTSDVNSLVSVFGEDLLWKAGEAMSNVFAHRFEQDEDLANPAPHWVIQWNLVTADSSIPEDTLTFQVKLFDSGRIEYHYAEMTGTDTDEYYRGTSANAWLEAPDGAYALMHHGYSRYNVGIESNTAVAFVPSGN